MYRLTGSDPYEDGCWAGYEWEKKTKYYYTPFPKNSYSDIYIHKTDREREYEKGFAAGSWAYWITHHYPGQP